MLGVGNIFLIVIFLIVATIGTLCICRVIVGIIG